MPLATDRDPSGVKQKNLSLTTGSQIGNLFLVRSLTTEDTETTDGEGTTKQTNLTNRRKLIGFGGSGWHVCSREKSVGCTRPTNVILGTRRKQLPGLNVILAQSAPEGRRFIARGGFAAPGSRAGHPFPPRPIRGGGR